MGAVCLDGAYGEYGDSARLPALGASGASGSGPETNPGRPGLGRFPGGRHVMCVARHWRVGCVLGRPAGLWPRCLVPPYLVPCLSLWVLAL